MQERGFTLLEVLVVVVLIGLLASLVGPHVWWEGQKAMVRLAEAKCQTYHDAVHGWMLLEKVREVPGSLEEVDGKHPALHLEPDPWGSSYRLVKEGRQKFRIWSNGPDGEEGTDDDLCYEPRESLRSR